MPNATFNRNVEAHKGSGDVVDRGPNRSPLAYAWFFSKLVVVGGALYFGIAYAADRFKIAYDSQVVSSLHTRYVLYDTHDVPELDTLARGDVIVFQLPPDKRPAVAPWPEDHLFAKRVGGLPGDVVVIDPIVTSVNGEGIAIGLDLADRLNTTPDALAQTLTVPEGEFFPIGDSLRSYDGRYMGTIDRQWLRGRVLWAW